jgi:hypothetical protein
MYHDMVHDGLDRDAEWLGEFKGSRGQIDGVFTLAASSEDTVNNWMADGINPRFSKTVRWLFTQSGAVLNKYDIEQYVDVRLINVDAANNVSASDGKMVCPSL